MSNSENIELKNRLTLIHNQTLCGLMRLFNSDPQREYSTKELRTASKLNSSTMFNSLKKLIELGYIERFVRGHYKINYIVGPSLIKMLDELKKNKLPKRLSHIPIDNYLSLIRRYKNPYPIFSILLTHYRTLKISDLVKAGVSRATAFRILKELTDLGLLMKNEKEKNWKITSYIDLLRKIILSERTEIPGKIQKIFQNLKQNLPSFVEYGGAVICSVEGFPVIIDSLEKQVNEFSAMISAQMNLATKQCSTTDSNLEFFINFTEKGFIIAYALERITLALIFHIEHKFNNFQKLIQILNDTANKIELEAEKLKIEL